MFLIAFKLVIHVLLLGFGTLQAFLHACYTPGNLPLKSFPDSVANFSSIVKQVKVRGTSRELRPVATPQQSASSSPMVIVPGMSDMMNKIEEQARALDALKNQMANSDKVSLPSSSFSSSLGSLAASSVTSPLLSPKALPAVADPLPLPAPAAHEAQGSCDPVVGLDNNDSHAAKSLEDYEQEAMEKVSKKKARVLDTKMPCLKRPASKQAAKAAKVNVAQKSKAVMKGQDKHVTAAFLKGIYGCTRCRGSIQGCDTCKSPFFKGKRFSSREEYNKWYQKK